MKNLHIIAKNIINSQNFQGEILCNEPMNRHTTFKIGGNADVFAIPHTIESLLYVLQELQNNSIPYFILGGGSNIVVSDNGIEGFVITTEKINKITVEESNERIILTAQAGCTIKDITDFCIENELSGLETFAGLPGSIGGAVFMNARCYDKSISDVLVQSKYISIANSQEITTYTMNTIDWNYKKSPFQTSDNSLIILSVTLLVKKGSKELITTECNKYITDRKQKGHYDFPCAGSVFKNNRNFCKPSGKIIDEVGLKGFTIGKAQIAPFHGNLIINLGDAFAEDIKRIVEITQKRVYDSTGFNLESEIIFVGKFKKHIDIS